MSILHSNTRITDSGWLGGSVVYHIFIDRFFRGGRRGRAGAPDASREGDAVFCGGNLQGVAAKLSYLSELGINSILLSPFNRTSAYHGYHITDYLTVDPRYGGERGFRELLKEARSHRIRLIMDFVPNHMSVENSIFKDAFGNAQDPRRNWFYWRNGSCYSTFMGVEDLPKVNLDTPAARNYMIDAAKHWIDRGIDGLRLDHALGPSLEFWREFRAAIRAHRSDVPLIGEVVFTGMQRKHLPTIRLPHKLAHFAAMKRGVDVTDSVLHEYTQVFDGLLDFYFQRLLKNQLARRRAPLSRRTLQKRLDAHYAAFPRACSLLSFLDNHDMSRFLYDAGDDKARLMRAAEIQFAQSAPPIVYYGTEIGMSQLGPMSGYGGDILARRVMRWNDRDRDVFDHFKRLIAGWKARREQAPSV